MTREDGARGVVESYRERRRVDEDAFDERPLPQQEPERLGDGFGTAARCGRVDDERALATLRGSLVHAEERLVVVAPRVLDLHEVQPDVVIRPILDGRVDERVGEVRVGAQPVADAPRLVPRHRQRLPLALRLAGAEEEDRLAVLADDVADELVRRADLQPIRAPPELLPRGRVALADKVDPEGVLDLRRELVRRKCNLLEKNVQVGCATLIFARMVAQDE